MEVLCTISNHLSISSRFTIFRLKPHFVCVLYVSIQTRSFQTCFSVKIRLDLLKKSLMKLLHLSQSVSNVFTFDLVLSVSVGLFCAFGQIQGSSKAWHRKYGSLSKVLTPGLQYYTGIFHAGRVVVRHEGLAGLYSGYNIQLCLFHAVEMWSNFSV